MARCKLAPCLVGAGLLLAACSALGGDSRTQAEGGDLYRPPPLSSPVAAFASPTSVPPSPAPPTPTPPSVAPTPECSDSLRYIEDVTIPDGSIAAPGEPLDKRWRVENSGTCNWDERYRLKLIAGPDLGAGETRALYPARSGTQADLQIIFTAPQEPGAYRSAWQAYNPAGQPFGDNIFIDFIVSSP